MGVPSDYESTPGRYRLGMAVTREHATASLYTLVAGMLAELDARLVLDVGCADGVLHAALPPFGPRVVGLDRAAPLLRAHPRPAVQADAAHLPFRGTVFDAVTVLNVLYHLPDPLPALREAHRVLRPGGHVLVSAISRDDSPELAAHWTRPRTSFDAEDAPDLLGREFGTVAVRSWDAPLVTLPDAQSIRDYLLGRLAPPAVADQAARDLPVPLTVTKRGALLVGARA
jgi:SAM-dependent methyltransferase